MTNTRILSISELKKLLIATESMYFETESLAETYTWIEHILRGYRYHRLRKKAKGLVRRYLEKMTGYAPGHINHLVERWLKCGTLTPHPADRHCFPRVYGQADILLLATIDRIHGRLSGPATRKILQREFTVFDWYPVF